MNATSTQIPTPRVNKCEHLTILCFRFFLRPKIKGGSWCLLYALASSHPDPPGDSWVERAFPPVPLNIQYTNMRPQMLVFFSVFLISHSLTGRHLGCFYILLQWSCCHVFLSIASFKQMPKSGSTWSQGTGTSHLDIASFLFKVIYHKFTSNVCELPFLHSLSDFPSGGRVFQYVDMQRRWFWLQSAF